MGKAKRHWPTGLGEHFVEIAEAKLGPVSWFQFTLTMKQAVIGPDGALQYLSEEEARKTVRYFVARVNRAVFKGACRRKGKRLCYLVSVEKGELGRWHAHALIERPARLSQQEFCALLQRLWSRCRWHHALNQFAPVQGGPEGVRKWAGYICKSDHETDLFHVREAAGPEMALTSVETSKASPC